MLGASFEHTAKMNANKSTAITQYITENLYQRKTAIEETLATRYVEIQRSTDFCKSLS